LEAYFQKPEPRAPVIALTAAGNLEKVIELGVDDFISKPFPIEVLYTYAKRYLRTPDSAGPGPVEAE
jgi:DNA-binding response OmpR family regulator